MAVLPGSQSQGTDLNCFTSWYRFPSTTDKPAISYNPLILPSSGHTGDLGGCPGPAWESQEADLP